MELEQTAQLESIFHHMSVGVAVLDCTDLRLRYANPYLLLLLDQSGRAIPGDRFLAEILPEEVWRIAQPLLQQVCATGQHMSWSDIPYEGFLAARGRTYWRVSIERTAVHELDSDDEKEDTSCTLFVTIEDVTELARSRLYVNAIDSISSAIVGHFALPLVLDSIL